MNRKRRVTMPLVTDARARLMECGSTNIVTPADWTTTAMAERILGQLVLEEAVQPNACGTMRGGTRQMRELYEQLHTFAALSEPILVLGETGTGKELVAQELHRLSKRTGKLVPINCPEISTELLPSELFGHERGAFTNATQSRHGLFVEAGSGTVFLDEIGELDLVSQAKLLRVLEDNKVRRVGANKWEDVKARVVLATNRSLLHEVTEKRFREDLRQRMQAITLHLPPLRQRKADIPLLAHHFVTAFSQKYTRPLLIGEGALDCLFRYDWPGNVRELRGVVWKAATYPDAANQISALILQDEVRKRLAEYSRQAPPAPVNELPSSADNVGQTVSFDAAREDWQTVKQRFHKVYFQAVMEAAKGNKEAAARLAGLSRTQLYDNLKKLGEADVA